MLPKQVRSPRFQSCKPPPPFPPLHPPGIILTVETRQPLRLRANGDNGSASVLLQVAQALSTRVDILDANYLQQIELLQVRHRLACVCRCCVTPGCLPCGGPRRLSSSRPQSACCAAVCAPQTHAGRASTYPLQGFFILGHRTVLLDCFLHGNSACTERSLLCRRTVCRHSPPMMRWR